MATFMKTVSGVFHPLLLSTYMTTLLFLLSPQLIGSISVDRLPTLIAAIFLTTFLLPAFSIGFMKLTSRVSNFELTQREERILPFISISLFYLVTYYMFISQFRIAPTFMVILLTVTSLIFTLLLITFWFKISIHGAANWATIGILTQLFFKEPVWFYPLIIGILSAGLVSTSRLYLGYHTPKEIWIGSIYGYAYSFLALLIFD